MLVFRSACHYTQKSTQNARTKTSITVDVTLISQPAAMISVIIPTWNRASLLPRAVQSVFAQTLACSELIIVDDGSTDTTPEVISELKKNSPVPLRHLAQENQGAAAARNQGIQTARGDILCFLDSDDWWHRRKLEIQYAALQARPEIGIAHTREIWYRQGQRVNQKKKHQPGNGDIFARSLHMCVVGMSTVMIKKNLFARYGYFDPTMPCCEDYDLWLRLSWQEHFLLVDTPLTFKDGGRPDQLSAIHRLGMDRYRIRALCKLLDTAPLSPSQKKLAVAELARKCRIYGRGCCKHGRSDEGNHYLHLAARYQEPVTPDQEDMP